MTAGENTKPNYHVASVNGETNGPPVPCMKNQGRIQIILGPMFSGKTTELIRRLKRFQLANQKCLIIKYHRDNGYPQPYGITTHDQQNMEATACVKLNDLKINHNLDEFSVIGVDEAQFFPDAVSFAEEMANLGKTVIVAALDGSYQRTPFGDILNLVPLAENVIKLTAVCMICFEEASFSKRIGEETELQVIGGTEKYMALCRQCYMKQPSVAETAIQ